MAQTYAELLKSQGASEDEIKVLVTPASEKAYAALQAQANEYQSKAAKAEADKAAYDKWYKEVAEPTAAKALAERDQALGDAAAERARVKKLSDLGLLKIAEQMEGGGGGEPATPPAGGATVTPPDMSKFVDRDTLLQLAEREGDAIAAAQDIAFEHSRLFPDKPLNFRELRKQAVANKQSVEQQWMTNYNVVAARDARAAADKEAYEKKLREEGGAAVRAELQKSNPHLIAPTTSSSPFTSRPPSANDPSAQPWNISDAERANRRIQKGVDGLGKHGVM